jgi:glycosyltransferase involved in cell wall biosynthesis
MPTKKSVFIISDRWIDPPSDGRKASLNSFIDGLSDNYKLHVVYLAKSREHKAKFKNINSIHFVKTSGFFEIFKNLFLLIFFKRFPLQCVFFSSKRIIRTVNDIINLNQPDVVVFSMMRTAQLSLNINHNNKVFDMDDCLSLRYKRQIKQSDFENRFGSLGKTLLPKIITTSGLISPLLKLAMIYEQKSTENLEKKISKSVKKVVVVNQNEENYLINYLGIKNVSTIPLRIKTHEKSIKINNNSNQYNIAFHGSLLQKHNIDAYKFINDKILPELMDRGYKFVLNVYGPFSGNSNELFSYPNVKFHGYVENLYDELIKNDCYVAPLFEKGGIKTKLLEAMAVGLPVITTNYGVDGLGIDGKKIIICENQEQFTNQIIKLINNKDYALKLSENGKLFVKENFSPEENINKWKTVLFEN